MSAGVNSATQTWVLPPLILHPFSDAASPNQIVESSRASLVLHGLLPRGNESRDELERKLLAGRYCELRMLFYVGKDLVRWIEQCLEFTARQPQLACRGYRFESFAAYLVYDPPAGVQEKLRRWGVADYKGIFSRALGIQSVFAEPPARESLAPEFLRYYYKFADQLFATRLHLVRYPPIDPAEFDFALYASGEYARLLEREWAEE
jgi:hypothetical protein